MSQSKLRTSLQWVFRYELNDFPRKVDVFSPTHCLLLSHKVSLHASVEVPNVFICGVVNRPHARSKIDFWTLLLNTLSVLYMSLPYWTALQTVRAARNHLQGEQIMKITVQLFPGPLMFWTPEQLSWVYDGLNTWTPEHLNKFPRLVMAWTTEQLFSGLIMDSYG
jgi:hypothetical protein